MRIYEMTATFGKLERQTLTLQPGLNIIHAPNEWGKSTWCAFLLAMLYGIDTRERSKQGALADKERYAPWSGAAMEGRILLNWQGRDITIERSSTARMPLGVFRAYDTLSGAEIPELNAANCGQMLLGVERSVFVRTGFLRLWDMPVTQDDALRRRLNDLVTTGDESDAADRLGKSLKELRNRCRANRSTGLLPEAEQLRDQLRSQLWDREALEQRMEQLRKEMAELDAHQADLEHHLQVLDYRAFVNNREKLQKAHNNARQLAEQAEKLKQEISRLPGQEEARKGLEKARRLLAQKAALRQRKEALPAAPVPWAGGDPEEALEKAQKDFAACAALDAKKKRRKKLLVWLGSLGILALAGCILCIAFSAMLPGICLGAAAVLFGAGLLLWKQLAEKKHTRLRNALCAAHPGQDPGIWETDAREQLRRYRMLVLEQERYRAALDGWEQENAMLQTQLASFGDPEEKEREFTHALEVHARLEQIKKEQEGAEGFADTLETLIHPLAQPEGEDKLNHSPEETTRRLHAAEQALNARREELAQCRGRLNAQPGLLQEQLDGVNRRIERLETYASAIEMAQDALFQATVTLQQKFAPRITKRAGEIFSRLTGGRYDRLTLDGDFSLQTAASDEIVLRKSLYRSEGTVDQLYLSLRLAAAEALTPHAPLVLDDALARFDDARMATALDILEQTATDKQVILFTCRKRETDNIM